MQAENIVLYDDLPMIDQHALFQLENVVKNITESYEKYQFFKIFQVRNVLMWLATSNLFLFTKYSFISYYRYMRL